MVRAETLKVFGFVRSSDMAHSRLKEESDIARLEERVQKARDILQSMDAKASP